ncbi:hypothetical protein [Achromobacter xylosoxidans]
MNHSKSEQQLQAHLEQLRALSSRIGEHAAFFRNAGQAARAAEQTRVKIGEALQRTLQPIIAHQEKWARDFRIEWTPPGTSLVMPKAAERIANFQQKLRDSFGVVFGDLYKGFQELPPRTQKALLLLGQHGWYLDPMMPMSALWRITNEFADEKHADAEASLAAYFEDAVARIEKSISEKFPHRRHIFQAAFAAHNRGEYVLSVPVLLAQADGICKESVNQYLFIKNRKDKRPQTAIYVEQFAADAYMAAILSPLAASLPIAASESERHEGFVALNRHTVLHGDSLDYGTRVNSLKAISLANYVAQVLPVDGRESASAATDPTCASWNYPKGSRSRTTA